MILGFVLGISGKINTQLCLFQKLELFNNWSGSFFVIPDSFFGGGGAGGGWVLVGFTTTKSSDRSMAGAASAGNFKPCTSP